ncbi:MAG: histone deacetylase [Bacteroidetes bacterium]|nr:histone deacetylase [Bacteroidota bacterium]
MRKFERLFAYLTQKDIIPFHNVIEPGMMDLSTLRGVHTENYTNEIMFGFTDKLRARRLGLPWSIGLMKRSFLACQGTLNAALMALQDGISGNLAGGTHHSFPDHGEGFCVFNDVAIAIKYLKASLWIKKALIIDCDVHQGNGTASIFSDDDSVYTFSIHGEKNYPFRKQASTFDIGLTDNLEDADYLKTLEIALSKISHEFEPDIIFYLGGIDVLKGDRFGRLALSLHGLRRRDEVVIKFAKELHSPLVLLLSGGYAPTVEETVLAHAQQFEAAVASLN